VAQLGGTDFRLRSPQFTLRDRGHGASASLSASVYFFAVDAGPHVIDPEGMEG